MKNCQELSNILTAKYVAAGRVKKIPELKLHISHVEPEGFTSKYAAGVLTIDSAGAYGHACGIAQMTAATKAGHLADYLGKTTPKFPLRLVWLDTESEVEIADLVTIHLPFFMLNPDLMSWVPQTAQRLIELGYNAILLGCRKSIFVPNVVSQKVDLQSVIKMFGLYGIKVILKPNLQFLQDDHCSKCPLDEAFRASLTKALSQLHALVPACNSIMWESMLQSPRFRFHQQAKDLTLVDIVIQEVQLVEKCHQLQGKKGERELIFYLPLSSISEGRSHAEWIPTLLDEMGEKTTFAFSSVQGNFCHDHLPDHPLWQQLRQSPDCSATPLLPIVNLGAVEQGEGLWPATNFDLIERFYPRLRRHTFAGVIGVVNHLPEEGSFLDGLLWVAGQSLWRDMPPSMLAETWFSAYREEKDFAHMLLALKAVRKIVLEFSLLRSLENNEERRRIGEPLAMQLKEPTYFFDKKEWVMKRPSMKDYFNLFVCDTKRFLEQSLQLSCRAAFGSSFGHEEPQSSFWTHPKGRGDFLVKPQEGFPGSVMEAIYKENRFL
ncbi:MAG: hypothetical protein H0U49_05005 [Parachlamydiaceae bacterium]|nr:hypothetical protein [Parachlamydiaceae bacterium]